MASIIVNHIGELNFSSNKIPPIINAKNQVKGFNIVDFAPLASECESSSLTPVNIALHLISTKMVKIFNIASL